MSINKAKERAKEKFSNLKRNLSERVSAISNKTLVHNDDLIEKFTQHDLNRQVSSTHEDEDLDNCSFVTADTEMLIHPFPTHIIALQIFGYLDPKILLTKFMLVNHEWSLLAGENCLWHDAVEKGRIPIRTGIVEYLLEAGLKSSLWKLIYRDGYLLKKNWEAGKYTISHHGVGDSRDCITCFKADQDKVICGTRRHNLVSFYTSSLDNTRKAKPDICFENGHSCSIASLSFSDNSDNLLASGDKEGNLCLWNIYTGNLLDCRKLAHKGGITTIILTMNRLLFTAGFDHVIRIYRIVEEVTLVQSVVATKAVNLSDSYSTNQNNIPLLQGQRTRANEMLFQAKKITKNNSLKIKNTCKKLSNKMKNKITTNNPPSSIPKEPIIPKRSFSIVYNGECVGHGGDIYTLVQLDGKTIASASIDHTVKIWNICTGECLNTLRRHTDIVSSLCASGTFLFSSSIDRTIIQWNWKTGDIIKTLKCLNGWTRSMGIYEHRLLAGGWNGFIDVWDWKEGTVSYSLNLERGPITNLQVDARKITVTCLDQGVQNELVVVDFAAEIS